MKDYFDKLQQKYNYDDKMILILKKIIIELADYYGRENLKPIFDNIFKTEIHIRKPGEDPNEYISKSLGIKDEYITSERVDGYVTTRPYLLNGEIHSKSIIYLFNDLDSNNPLTWVTLVHELCHLIKRRDFLLKDDHYYTISGFQSEYYDLNGKLIGRHFESLEETTTSYDEKHIMNSLLKSNDYKLLSTYVIAEEYWEKIIEIMNNSINGFEISLRRKGKHYAEEIFGPWGLTLLDNLFEKCITVFTKELDNEDKFMGEMLYDFKLIQKTLNDLFVNYKRVNDNDLSEEEKKFYGI